MSDPDFPPPDTRTERRPRFSWVWLMPLLAIAISVGLVWQTYSNQGPMITVSFPIAAGIEAGETPLRFRDVQVGLVEDIGFSDGFGAVEARIRLDPSVADFVDDGAEFWLVEPEVSARGITGLSTVLTGVYIEGSWDGEIGAFSDTFTALEDTPLSRPNEPGTRIILRAREGGQLAAGAPVLFNGIEVGRLGVPEFSDDDATVVMEAFINAPHDERLSTATRFWDISGISVDLNTSGLSINFESIASLVEGGVAFGALVTGGEPIEPGHVYEVFSSEAMARRSVFEAPVNQPLEVAVLLPANELRLALGAVVRYRGIRVGEVTDIIGFTDPRAPDEGVQILVRFSLSASRIGLRDVPTEEELIDDLASRVLIGLRVRVASEGLLGTTVILEVIEEDEPDGQSLARDLIDVPILPATAPNVTEASANLDAVVDRVAALPIEDLINSAIEALNGVAVLSTDEDLQNLPTNLNSLVTEARAVVAAEEIETTLSDLSGAAEALQGFITRISGSDGVTTTLTALEGSDTILANLETFTNGLNQTLASVDGFVEDLAETEISTVAASADRVIRRIETILASEDAGDLPASLNTTLTELSAILGDLREGNASENLVGTLASADAAFAAFETAAAQVPAIVNQLNTLVASLQGLSNDYDDNSPVYREIRGAIQDISQAADAFRSLARAIERNPNSLISGR